MAAGEDGDGEAEDGVEAGEDGDGETEDGDVEGVLCEAPGTWVPDLLKLFAISCILATALWRAKFNTLSALYSNAIEGVR